MFFLPSALSTFFFHVLAFSHLSVFLSLFHYFFRGGGSFLCLFLISFCSCSSSFFILCFFFKSFPLLSVQHCLLRFYMSVPSYVFYLFYFFIVFFPGFSFFKVNFLLLYISFILSNGFPLFFLSKTKSVKSARPNLESNFVWNSFEVVSRFLYDSYLVLLLCCFQRETFDLFVIYEEENYRNFVIE
jgi:hypothetical protein